MIVPEYYIADADEDDESDNAITPESLDIAASAFYQESLREDPDRKYRLRVRSPCQIDVDKLNKNMHLTVWGRRK